MNVGVILAGGVGNRVGAGIPKQFIEIGGHPIIAYTIKKYQDCEEIDKIEIVCHKDYISYMEKLKEKYKFNKIEWITEGGDDFQHSVMNGVNNLNGKINDDDIISIHFAANPFVSNEIIVDSLRVAKEKGNAISTCPCYVLYGSNDGDKSTKWLDRDSIVQMSSPHSFKQGYIYSLYKEAVDKDIISKVEPHTTTLMYKMGQTIYFSCGNQTNIKITTKEDLMLFEGYVLINKIKLI